MKRVQSLAGVVAMVVTACAGAASVGSRQPAAGEPRVPDSVAADLSEDFGARELLARPTDHSVTIRALAARALDVYAEWGTSPGRYVRATPPARVGPGEPVAILLDGLQPDTSHVYRLRWRRVDGGGYAAGLERTFQTQRPPGRPFTFVVQADPHLDDNSSTAVYSQTLQNELADRPDFVIDLGDTSMVDKCAMEDTALCAPPGPATAASVWARNLLMRSYFDQVAHSVPLFMVLGNHDGENGWQGEATLNNLNGWSVTARKKLYANPEPDGFYTGNADPSPVFGPLQNYYAFEWGDALFVALDPFTYTTRKPGRGSSSESWAWTLGEAQYRWLAETLASSRARFKFVFAHHLVGGNGGEARGGAAFAPFFEWGGRDLDGTWAFERYRPGWPAPIHQLLVQHGVTAFFHGHDHLYAREERDGVIYQEVPQPSLSRYDTPNPGAGYGYVGTVGQDLFASSGHLRVAVSANEVRVDYVRSVATQDETPTRQNGSIVRSYVVR